MTQLRLQGIDDLADVKACYMEGNGHISVLRASGQDGDEARRPASRPAS